MIRKRLAWVACLWIASVNMVQVWGQQPAEDSQRDPVRSPVAIVAHRGASGDAPENTLAAFRLGWEQAADAIEGDFFLTADEVIVALHDRDAKRTAGKTLDVTRSTLAQLQSLDVGAWKSDKYRGEKIPTLQQVLGIIPPTKKLFLEIKDSPRLVPVLKKQLSENDEWSQRATEQIVIIAFDAEVIAACKRQLPSVPAMWLTSFKRDDASGEIRPTIDEILVTLKRIGADGLDCRASEHIDETFVARLRENGYQFHVWTVDNPAVAQRFVELGVDSITTNFPAVIRSKCELDRP